MADNERAFEVLENEIDIHLLDEKRKEKWTRTPLQAKSIPKILCWVGCGCSIIVIIGIAATIWGLQSNKKTQGDESEETKMTNLVVIGGSTGSGPRLSTSELLSWNGSCRGSFEFPRLPTGVTGARSVYVHGHVMLCGGWNVDGDCQDNCYKLDGESEEWTTTSPLQHKRSYFSLIKVNEELYALGGYGNRRHIKIDTMEKFTNKNKWILMSEKMRSPRTEHCGVYLPDKNSLFVIGGIPSTKVVEMFNLATMTWSASDPLPLSDLRGHACLVLKENKEESIVVTGGWSDGDGGRQRKVYRYKNSKWSREGQTVETRSWHTMGLFNGRLVIVGGRNTENENLKSLERMDSQGLWKLMAVRLNFRRSGHSMVAVPDEAFPCLL